MEKADILEMTVNHLRQLQRQHMSVPDTTDQASFINKYQLGFNECATEVSRYLSGMDGLDVELRARLLNHLANCVTEPSTDSQQLPLTVSITSPSKVTSTTPELLCAKIKLSPPVSTRSDSDQPTSSATNINVIQVAGIPNQPTRTLTIPQNNGMLLLPKQHVVQPTQQPTFVTQNSVGTLGSLGTVQTQPSLQVANVVSGIQILPTKIPTGEIALVLPASMLDSSQIPSYVIPVYSSSNVNAASTPVFTAANILPQIQAKTSVIQSVPQTITITNIPQAAQNATVPILSQSTTTISTTQRPTLAQSAPQPVLNLSAPQTALNLSAPHTALNLTTTPRTNANIITSPVSANYPNVLSTNSLQLPFAVTQYPIIQKQEPGTGSPTSTISVIKPKPITIAPIPLVFPYHSASTSTKPTPQDRPPQDHPRMEEEEEVEEEEEEEEDMWRPW